MFCTLEIQLASKPTYLFRMFIGVHALLQFAVDVVTNGALCILVCNRVYCNTAIVTSPA